MWLQSKTIASFVKRLENDLKQIIQLEMGLKVGRTRFEFSNKLYPIQVVVFERPGVLGYFDQYYYQIGLHRQLMYLADRQQIKNILRHEMAHYLCFLMYGSTIRHHGREFKELCRRFGWQDEISRAKTKLQENSNFLRTDIQSDQLLTKIKKLLALGKSENPHEAKLATAKANQLLIDHNLELLEQNQHDPEYGMLTLCERKKKNSEMDALYQIIGHFMVRPILNYGSSTVRLDIMGERENLTRASYIADFLSSEFKYLWQQQPSLKGLQAKNSFYRGLAEGFCNQLKQVTNNLSTQQQNQLILGQKKLDNITNAFFPRLSQSKSFQKNNETAYQEGQLQGKKISLRQGLQTVCKTKLLC